MNTDLSRAAILDHLNRLIELQSHRLGGSPRCSADDTLDWLAVNFLFRVGREYQRLSAPAREQLGVIFRGWTAPEPLSLAEFTSMLETLRELISDESKTVRVAEVSCVPRNPVFTIGSIRWDYDQRRI